MEAQISGSQRKVFGASVRPSRSADGDSGITLRDGRTCPFVVARSWSAPAGVYAEAWYLVDPKTREVLYEGASDDVAVWGLQGLTELTTEVSGSIALAPGTYEVVFALGGIMGGRLDVTAAEGPSEAAA